MGLALDDCRHAPLLAARVHRAGQLAAGLCVVGWIVVLARIASHSLFVSHDTVIDYAHAWYIAGRVWHGHGVPFHMTTIGHGKAFAFTYGAPLWLLAALLRPLFGDWSTTLVLVVGSVGLAAATFWAFPELRSGWWATAVLIEPAMVSSPIIGQIPFVCGAALLVAAIGAWRRDRWIMAIVAAGLAQVTHPAVLVPLTAVVVVGQLPFEPRRWKLLRCWLASAVLAAPAGVIVLRSPVFEDTSVLTKFGAFMGTVGPRSLIIVVPVALVLLQRHRSARSVVGVSAVATLLVLNLVMWSPLGMPWAWGALSRRPDTRMVAFTTSGAFVAGATYRVLRVGDGKLGMYQLLEHGARLDSEFFPESIAMNSWPSGRAYRIFLDRRHVDYVMVWHRYDLVMRTNEHALLATFVTEGCSEGHRTRLAEHTSDFDLYAVAVPCSPHQLSSGETASAPTDLEGTAADDSHREQQPRGFAAVQRG